MNPFENGEVLLHGKKSLNPRQVYTDLLHYFFTFLIPKEHTIAL